MWWFHFLWGFPFNSEVMKISIFYNEWCVWCDSTSLKSSAREVWPMRRFRVISLKKYIFSIIEFMCCLVISHKSMNGSHSCCWAFARSVARKASKRNLHNLLKPTNQETLATIFPKSHTPNRFFSIRSRLQLVWKRCFFYGSHNLPHATLRLKVSRSLHSWAYINKKK